jgi:hypothetical protein
MPTPKEGKNRLRIPESSSSQTQRKEEFYFANPSFCILTVG